MLTRYGTDGGGGETFFSSPFFLNAKSKCCLTVNPGHGDGFKENGDEDGKSGCEAVQQVEKVKTALWKYES